MALAYMQTLRKAVSRRPLRMSFLLMWAPLPTSLCPFLVGFMVPTTELPLRTFVLGAVPSKLLHFTLDVCIGIEAGSFAEALNHHDGGAEKNKWARTLSAGTLALTLAIIAAMVVQVHEALHDIKAKEEAAQRPAVWV